MAKVIPDSMDFSAYMVETEAAVKVRKAADFAADLRKRFLPPERRERFPEMFSTKLRGGIEFRPGEVTCWAGYNGHRKSTFAGQVMLDLAVQRQRVLNASYEMHPADTLHRAARQALGGELQAGATIDRFLEWTDDRIWLFDHVGVVQPRLCLGVGRYFAEELRGQHYFVDSMMMVCQSEDTLDEQKRFVTDFITLCRDTGMHGHLVVHCRKPTGGDESKPPTKYDIKGTGAISDQAHNVITVWANKAKKAVMEAGAMHPKYSEMFDQPDAMVSVEKQRNGRWEGRVKLWFHEDSMRFTDDHQTDVAPYRLSEIV